jgi:hypothetical protein
MKGWIRRTCVGCVVALALGGPLAHASSGGTITFAGAIVAPTCGFLSTSQSPIQHGGGGCGTTMAASASPTSVYRQEVIALENVLESQDRLLNYFASYAGASNTRLLIRTYE